MNFHEIFQLLIIYLIFFFKARRSPTVQPRGPYDGSWVFLEKYIWKSDIQIDFTNLLVAGVKFTSNLIDQKRITMLEKSFKNDYYGEKQGSKCRVAVLLYGKNYTNLSSNRANIILLMFTILTIFQKFQVTWISINLPSPKRSKLESLSLLASIP